MQKPTVPLYDPFCENGFQESPQTFLKPEILNDFPLKMPKAHAAGILNRLARWKSAFLARFTVRFVWTSPKNCDKIINITIPVGE